MNFCHCENCNSQTTLDDQGACTKCSHVQSWKEASNVKNVQRQSTDSKEGEGASEKTKKKSIHTSKTIGV